MHEMHSFLAIAARHLAQPMKSELAVEPEGKLHSYVRRSAATFTTFDLLARGGVYLSGHLPLESELHNEWVSDFAWGTGGPIRYDHIAHVLIPRYFDQETFSVPGNDLPEAEKRIWNCWAHEQDIDGLSKLLQAASISHSLTQWALEIKRF